MGAIFSYGFSHADEAFISAGCPYFVLTDYLTLIAEASSMGYIEPTDMLALEQWRENPQGWQST